MSRTLKEMYERLSGINLVREKLHHAAAQLDKLADIVLDHERRLVRLETQSEIGGGKASKRGTTPGRRR